MYSFLVNSFNSDISDRGVVFLAHQTSKSRSSGILGQSMILNNAYRAIALLSLIGAFIFGALINSGVQYVENKAVAEFLIDQPIEALTYIVVQPTKKVDL